MIEWSKEDEDEWQDECDANEQRMAGIVVAIIACVGALYLAGWAFNRLMGG